MILYLTKLLTVILSPIGVCLSLSIIALILIKCNRLLFGFWVLSVSILLLLIFSSPIVSRTLTVSLERQHLPSIVEELPKVDAIIVLGGALDGPYFPRKYLDMGDGGDRVLHAFRLFRAKRANKIIVSGGFISFLGSEMSEAILMRNLLVDWGIPKEAIILETASRNTYENAVQSQNILIENGLSTSLLVTSALHMPRAIASFRKQGIDVISAPTDFLIVDTEIDKVFLLLPSSDALQLTTYAFREYLGYFYYWLNERV